MLSILWTLAIVALVAFAVMDFAGLAVSPTLVVPGIQGIRSGQTVNGELNYEGNWTGDPLGTASNLSYGSAGGNPDGHLRIALFTSGAQGFWMQPFTVEGSAPYAAVVRMDVRVSGSLIEGLLFVSVDGAPSNPDPRTAIGNITFDGPTQWMTTGVMRADERLLDPGIYYLKIAFIANATSGPVDVALDNIRLAWTTDAGVVLFLPAPLPVAVLRSQDPTLFLVYYGFIVALLFLAALFYVLRDRRATWAAFRAPIDGIGARLRARSGWIAIGQVWMAVTSFQIAVIILLPFLGIKTPSPIDIDSRNAWVALFELANAGVYEELAYRMLLIGVPMALASAVVRFLEVNRGTYENGPGSAGRYIAGAWRYLIGGVIRRDAPRETLVVAWALLFASSALFGLAHLPAWGWWKVFPSLVAGLGFGYLFLRHGIGAAMLAHFVNNYAAALTYEGIGGESLEILLGLMLLGLTVAGAGFLLWYGIVAWRQLNALVDRFRPSRPRATPPSVPVTAPPPSPFVPAIQPPGSQGPSYSPASPGPFPVPTEWRPGPAGPPPAMALREPGRIPGNYVPSYAPPPYGYPPVRFQCPSCAWVEARYDAGRFTCTRCGRTA